VKTIWKFTLSMTESQVILMPEGAAILSVQAQHNRVCLWALVVPNKPREKRVFRIFATGQPYAEEGNYIGTVQIDDGSLVWHVFEVEP
jgi:hypothetical protein